MHTAREVLEFGAALPVVLRRMGVDSTDERMVLFERHVVLLGYMQARRIRNEVLVAVCRLAKELGPSMIRTYGDILRKPKQHFTSHIDLSFDRCVACYISIVFTHTYYATDLAW